MRRPIILLAAFAGAFSTRAAEISPDERFQSEVWPLLERTCLRCHGEEKQKSGLRLDSREAALKGGESGAALVPGKPADSLLLQLVRHADADRPMPPKEKLLDSEIANLERWIEEGAPWPAPPIDDPPATVEKLGDAWSDPRNPIVKLFAGKRLDLWSLKPIANPQPPQIENARIRNPIDAFFFARAEPRPEADSRTLCRRIYFDLTGLPPSPEEVDAFIQSAAGNRESAVESLVEKLLASPRYGEHWARLWLDVVRYSDSNGFDWDEFRPQAWRFRDYVIRSLNADKPFDRFVREQLAGDELLAGPPRDSAEQDCLIATGYLRLGPHDNTAAQFGEGPRVRAALMNDLVETTGSAFLGLTLSCARCHNHKFDPISQADYYRLRAFFEGVKFADDLPIDLAPRQEEITRANEATEAQMKEKSKMRDDIAAPAMERLRAENIAKLPTADQALLQLPADKRDAKTKTKIKVLEKKVKPADEEIQAALGEEDKRCFAEANAALQELKKKILPFTTALLAVDENAKPPVTRVLFQGDITKAREPVPPGFLSALEPNAAAISQPARESSSGRRTALADWLVSENNPLTARVLVNRMWQAHFGEGLVATSNDFGFAGARPSNPELLDRLASEFKREGWSLKKLHRLIISSATYQQSAPPRRLTAESLRDSMLAVAGHLFPCKGGAPVWPALPDEVLRVNPAFLDDNAEKTKGWYPTPHGQTNVRSIYLVQKRTMHVPLMETFDLPDNTLSCPGRTVSTIAPQALTLLNSPFAAEMAHTLAERILREAGTDTESQIERTFAVVFQRPPDPSERISCSDFRKQHSHIELCRALLNLNEFLYVD